MLLVFVATALAAEPSMRADDLLWPRPPPERAESLREVFVSSLQIAADATDAAEGRARIDGEWQQVELLVELANVSDGAERERALQAAAWGIGRLAEDPSFRRIDEGALEMLGVRRAQGRLVNCGAAFARVARGARVSIASRAWLMAGQCHLEAGDYDAAHNAFERVPRRAPDDFRRFALYGRAWSDLHRGDRAGAVRVLSVLAGPDLVGVAARVDLDALEVYSDGAAASSHP